MDLYIEGGLLDIRTHLAESVEYRVKVDQYLALGHFRDIVQALRREVPDAVLRIREAYEQWFHELLHVWRDVDSQCDGCTRESNQTAIPYMKWI